MKKYIKPETACVIVTPVLPITASGLNVYDTNANESPVYIRRRGFINDDDFDDE